MLFIYDCAGCVAGVWGKEDWAKATEPILAIMQVRGDKA